MANQRGSTLTTAENIQPEEDLTPVALDHATTGAPEVETAEELAARAPVRPDSPTFAELGVRAETVQALANVGITHSFAIQELTLPIAMGGHDLIGQARTGTGKTLGFGVPMLERVLSKAEGADGVPQALVIVPTRELCIQVARDIESAGKERKIRVLPIYGGRAYDPQVDALRKGIDVVVGTPGRLIDLAEQQKLVLGKVSVLVLDEADEMLDLGFLPDIEKILRMVPDARQTMLFSATMPGPIVTLARQFMRQPTHIRAELPDELQTVPTVKQLIYRAHALDKVELLSRILQARDRGLTLVFTRTKRTAQKVADELVERGFAAAAVHGDLGQGAREQALRAFRSGKVDTLIATDVAARGLDITGVSHVVNYQCPEDEKTFLHRIGRTGRAGAEGIAITFVDWDDVPRWQLINTALGLGFDDPVETYSSSKHLYSDLDIPDSAGSRLPRAQRTRAGLDAEQVEDLGETGRGNKRKRVAPRAESTSDDEVAVRPRVSRTKPRRRTRGSGAAAAAAGTAALDVLEDGQPVTPLFSDGAEDSVTVDGDDSEPSNIESGRAAATRRRRRGGRGAGRRRTGASVGDASSDEAPTGTDS